MSQSKIAARYAKSLIDLSREKSSLEQSYQDMLSLQSLCSQKDFALMLKSPIVSADKKENVIKALLADKISPLIYTFIKLLVTKGREPLLANIAGAFIAQYKSIQKIRTATLVTAVPQSETQLENFKKQFADWLKPGESMEIIHKVEPQLIGGFIFQMEGKQVDTTAKRKLEAFRTNLYDSSYTNLVVKS
ncbi:MAG: ATP synthase F1 subunit delta [Saprospiraceae bacterium]|nr:ATP synthase F1 subunit delta [Saprospiraceae bacterium]